jgi:hypothetical protein
MKMNRAHIKELYERLRALPVSQMAKQDIGSFMLYDALLAGYASRAAEGEVVDPSVVSVPSEETVAQINLLRGKEDLTADEKAYLSHFDLLEEIRSALCTP